MWKVPVGIQGRKWQLVSVGLDRPHHQHCEGDDTSLYPAKFVGIVEAPDADAAIKKAVKEFEIKIDPKRLLVVRRA